jgi:branched-chain amino acid transport system ATP-binding protein
MLRLEGIVAEYSGMKALNEVSIKSESNEVISIIGSNGAGKSTLLKAISGTVSCTAGDIYFRGMNITRMESYQRTRLGIIHVPEGRRVFPSMTVMENLELGAYRREARALSSETLIHVLEYFPKLKERAMQLAGTLSGGEQQMLTIGRGLMASPLLLMLDEPSLGLSPLMTSFIFDTVQNIRKSVNFGLILVEQRAVEALELCDRGYILDTGKVVLSGSRDMLMGNPMIQKSFLGSLG